VEPKALYSQPQAYAINLFDCQIFSDVRLSAAWVEARILAKTGDLAKTLEVKMTHQP
jgi:hypothetical protein